MKVEKAVPITKDEDKDTHTQNDGSGLENGIRRLSLGAPEVYTTSASTIAKFVGEDGLLRRPPPPPWKPARPKTPTKRSETSEWLTNPFPPAYTSQIGGLTPQIRLLRTYISSTLVHSHRFTRACLPPPLGIL